MSLDKIELATLVLEKFVFRRQESSNHQIGTVPVIAASGRHMVYFKICTGHEMANELLVATLADFFRLPVPRSFLVQFRVGDVPATPALREYELDDQLLGFGSSDCKQPSFSRVNNYSTYEMQEAFRKQPLSQWEDLIIFDEWVANSDRHGRNVLVGSEKQVSWIDHGEAFTGSMWYPADLDPQEPTSENKFLDLVQPVLTPLQKRRLLRKTKDWTVAFPEFPFEELIEASRAGRYLRADAGPALVAFLEYRIGYLQEILRSRLDGQQIAMGYEEDVLSS